MTPEQFIAKWRGSTLTEKSASQSHFNDLCRMLDVPTPTDTDRTGAEYTFEKAVKKNKGGLGFVDVWKNHCFGWEYKGPRKNLVEAYAQLKQYTDDLQNPRLLIVSDMQEIRIHTNFTDTIAVEHVIPLIDLRAPEKRELLRNCFVAPEKLRPDETHESVTAKAATRFAEITRRLRQTHDDERRVAHFINKLVFCLFVEDIGLLPDRVFADIVEEAFKQPDMFGSLLGNLFRAMAIKGGYFGATSVPWFNGGLFDDEDVLPVGVETARLLMDATRLDWSAINPAIFGSLFESGLDDKKRAEMASLFGFPTEQPEPQARLAFHRTAPNKGVGIHYTDPDTIMKIIEPVVLRPLRAEWEAVKARVAALFARKEKAKSGGEMTRLTNEARDLYAGFRARLGKFRVLDPACGSGNFLALALMHLKDFDLAVSREAEALGLPADNQRVGPEAVFGIEINPYAAELARLTVWITELQWQLRNGFGIKRSPILGKLDGIVCRDALINPDGSEAQWPAVDVVIGNPPFLGSHSMRTELGDEYTERLRSCFGRRLSGNCDLVVYWFEKAAQLIEAKKIRRFGLVATQSIRRLANREPLSKRETDLRIIDAWSDEPWVNGGASVRVSLVCVAASDDQNNSRLNGQTVDKIRSDLSADGLDLLHLSSLPENEGIAFEGTKKYGDFDIQGVVARGWLSAPLNPNGRPNSRRKALAQCERHHGSKSGQVGCRFWLYYESIRSRAL